PLAFASASSWSTLLLHVMSIGTSSLEVFVGRPGGAESREHLRSPPRARLPVVGPLDLPHPRWQGHREVACQRRDVRLVHLSQLGALLCLGRRVGTDAPAQSILARARRPPRE